LSIRNSCDLSLEIVDLFYGRTDQFSLIIHDPGHHPCLFGFKGLDRLGKAYHVMKEFGALGPSPVRHNTTSDSGQYPQGNFGKLEKGLFDGNH
jgi:hypothetical protein